MPNLGDDLIESGKRGVLTLARNSRPCIHARHRLIVNPSLPNVVASSEMETMQWNTNKLIPALSTGSG